MDLFGLTPDTSQTYQPPIALTIAGSDSGGGAGIQADLKTFAANKVFGTSVLTVITAQNTKGVTDVHLLPEPVIASQFRAVMEDMPPVAAKTGALGGERIISMLAELLQEYPIPQLVVDPVMVSKHGHTLLPDAAIKAFRKAILPFAHVVTPNRYEAEMLYGKTVEGLTSMKDAAKAIHDQGARHVVIKGSHLGNPVRDIYYDGTGFIEFGTDRVKSDRVHGSGCVFSACIAARLALGDAMEDAVAFSREYITGAIEKAPEIGTGISPVNPMHRVW